MRTYVVVSMFFVLCLSVAFADGRAMNTLKSGSNMANVQGYRLSLAEMKSISGGAAQFKCGPAMVLCGEGERYQCEKYLGVWRGWKCKTFAGRTRYLITACDDGTLNNCAHSGPQIECGSNWTCKDDFIKTRLEWDCVVDERTYFYIYDCKAW